MQGEFRIRIETDDPELERLMIEGIAQGAVEANMAWMAWMDEQGLEYPCCLGCGDIVYEPAPKCDDWCQLVDTAPLILRRKRATCFAVAAYTCAKRRMDGKECRVGVVPEVDEVYGQPIPHKWHAVVGYPDGGLEDPTAELKAAPGECQGGCPAEVPG